MTIAYKVINVAHGRHNRSERAALPANPRMKQFIGSMQTRVLPGRPVHLSEEQLQECLTELRDKSAARILEVRTLDGRLVDLDTMVAEAVKASPPLFNKRLDSVEHDIPTGILMTPHIGEDGALPQVLSPGATPDLLQEDEELAAPVNPIIPLPADALEIDEAAIAGATGEVVPEETASETPVERKNKKNRR